ASGVATRPIEDLDAYRTQLEQFVYHSGNFMKPIFALARGSGSAKRRIAYAEGEDERVLRAVQIVVDEKLALPVVIGRPAVIEQRISRLGLRVKPGVDFELINPEQDDRYREYWQEYYRLSARRGVTEDYAKTEMRRRATLIGAMLVHMGAADGMLCGTLGPFAEHLRYIDHVIGHRRGSTVYAAMNTLMLPDRQLTLVDTHVNHDPDAAQIAEITVLAAEELRRFGIGAKVALLSHSSFGSSQDASARKMREALAILRQTSPSLAVDGEMHGDAALDQAIRSSLVPDSRYDGSANLLVLPGIDAANISYNLLKTAAGNNVAIGPVLLGAAKPVNVLTPSATVRRIVNMTAWTVVDAISER
ncbi:MAG: NADP-dependent malic enzyme, partial [Actinobacteria bacterium]|nr:NADP-dependent malic enzyme [Actinomycetota bacterium]